MKVYQLILGSCENNSIANSQADLISYVYSIEELQRKLDNDSSEDNNLQNESTQNEENVSILEAFVFCVGMGGVLLFLFIYFLIDNAYFEDCWWLLLLSMVCFLIAAILQKKHKLF